MPKVNTKFYGHMYEVEAPYTEGHQLTAKEADALNRYFAEQVMNLVRGKANKDTDQAEVIELINEIAAGYEFGRTGIRTGDPVLRRAKELAIELVKAKPQLRELLEEQGVDMKKKTEVIGAIQAVNGGELWSKIMETARGQVEAAEGLL